VEEALTARGLGASDDDAPRERSEIRAGLGPEPLTTRLLDALRERLGASRDDELLMRPSPGGQDLQGRRLRDLFLSGSEYGPADGAAVEISDSFTVAVNEGGYVSASRVEIAGMEEEEDAREFVRTLARTDRIADAADAPPDIARLYGDGRSHYVARESDGVRRVRRAWISRGDGR
jgi:hypothetical protein